MSEFVFLYRSPKFGGVREPEEMQQSFKKWQAWFNDLTDKGHLKIYGQPLEHQGKVVGGKSKAITDGPYAETKDIIGGYSVVEAKDLDQAAKLAMGCPIIETGGFVEVRPVKQMDR